MRWPRTAEEERLFMERNVIYGLTQCGQRAAVGE